MTVESPTTSSRGVTVPLRELIHNEELFRTAVFRIRDGAITSYETLGND